MPVFTLEQEAILRRIAKEEAVKVALSGPRDTCFVAQADNLKAYDAELGWLELESGSFKTFDHHDDLSFLVSCDKGQ